MALAPTDNTKDRAASGKRLWWLNGNIIGLFLDAPIGAIKTFTEFYKGNGSRRRDYEHFENAEVGDRLLGYRKADRAIVAAFEVTKPLHDFERGKAIEFQKIKLEKRVTWADLRRTMVEPTDWNELGTGWRLTPMSEGVATAIRSILGWQNPPGGQSTTNSVSSSPVTVDDIESPDALDDLEAHHAETDDLPPTEREEVRKSRIGQGKFKKELIEHWGVCAVTGLSEQSLLRASHIKPWRDCDTNRERLDKFNGLLLAPHLDALFDVGLISFDDLGAILVSKKLPSEDCRLLGVNDGLRLRAVDERHKKYLRLHRKMHGFDQ